MCFCIQYDCFWQSRYSFPIVCLFYSPITDRSALQIMTDDIIDKYILRSDRYASHVTIESIMYACKQFLTFFLVRSSNFGWVVGNRSRCSSYSPCPRRWHPSLRSRCFWQYVPRWSHVCSNEDMAKMAQMHQRQPAALCHVFCHCRNWRPRTCHVKRYILSPLSFLLTLIFVNFCMVHNLLQSFICAVRSLNN